MRAIRGSWLVTGQRLYLFGREENRDAFAAEPGALPQGRQRALAGARGKPCAVDHARQRRVRIAPGDEFRHDKILGAQAEMQRARPLNP